jgi:hypothetical protein
MPPEYYEACDEVGMIANAEFPVCYAHFLPGTGEQWRQRVRKGADPAPANETLLREWTAAVKRHRNHPSLFCWVMGNEIWDGIPLRYDFQRIARQLDPGRFFVDSDGVWGDDFVVPGSNILKYKKDRDTLDLYFLSFNVFSHPFENPAKFQTPDPPIKPVVSHEEGNYVTFSRPDVVIRALTSMARVEDAALLFEVGVGRGTLVVSGLNHQRAAGRPENAWTIARMVDRAAATERPAARWPKSMLARPAQAIYPTGLEETHASNH